MAGVANVAGVDMRAAASAGNGAVVTRETITAKRGVVRYACATHDVEPIRGAEMAGIAFRGGHHVSRALTLCKGSIMATGTHAYGLGVVDLIWCYRFPRYATCRVTSVALIGTGNVPGYRLAMAIGTDTTHLSMIHSCRSNRYPSGRETLMTFVTNG